MHLPLYEKLNLVEMMCLRIKGIVLYRNIFGAFGDKSCIASPELSANPRCMRIGDSVSIRKGMRLECIEDGDMAGHRRWTGKGVGIRADCLVNRDMPDYAVAADASARVTAIIDKKEKKQHLQ